MPDEPTFDSIDAIEKHYGKAIKAASDDADKVRELKIEQREVTADFRDRSATRKELEAHRKALLVGSDLPEEVLELVQGNTVEELDASFNKMKALADKLRSASGADADAAAKLYGTPVQGGGAPPPPRENPDDAWVHDFEKRWNEQGAQAGGGVTKAEIDKYVQTRTGANLVRHLRDNSRIPAVRSALASVKD